MRIIEINKVLFAVFRWLGAFLVCFGWVWLLVGDRPRTGLIIILVGLLMAIISLVVYLLVNKAICKKYSK